MTGERFGVRGLARALKGTRHEMSAAGVSRAKRFKRIAFGDDEKITLNDALTQLDANTNPIQSKRAKAQQGKPQKPSHGPAKGKKKAETISEALRRKEVAIANLRELEEAEKRKSLISADEAQDAANEMVMAFRSAVLPIADELADRLASTSDAVKCKELVHGRVCEALTVLSRYQANAA